MSKIEEEIFFLRYYLGWSLQNASSLSWRDRKWIIEKHIQNEVKMSECEDVVLPARSRWRVQAKTFSDLCLYTVKVQCDYYSKNVAITVLDAIVKGKPVVHEWIVSTLNNPGDEVFTLHHHDANGNLLYKKLLKGIKLVGHKCNHDYDCEGSDLQDHELLFSYEEMQTVDNIN